MLSNLNKISLNRFLYIFKRFLLGFKSKTLWDNFYEYMTANTIKIDNWKKNI